MLSLDDICLYSVSGNVSGSHVTEWRRRDDVYNHLDGERTSFCSWHNHPLRVRLILKLSSVHLGAVVKVCGDLIFTLLEFSLRFGFCRRLRALPDRPPVVIVLHPPHRQFNHLPSLLIPFLSSYRACPCSPSLFVCHQISHLDLEHLRHRRNVRGTLSDLAPLQVAEVDVTQLRLVR